MKKKKALHSCFGSVQTRFKSHFFYFFYCESFLFSRKVGVFAWWEAGQEALGPVRSGPSPSWHPSHGGSAPTRRGCLPGRGGSPDGWLWRHYLCCRAELHCQFASIREMHHPKTSAASSPLSCQISAEASAMRPVRKKREKVNTFKDRVTSYTSDMWHIQVSGLRKLLYCKEKG